MLTAKQRLKLIAAILILSVLSGFFYAATGTSDASLSRSDRAAIDGYNDLMVSCHAGNGGCRAAEAQLKEFHEVGICQAFSPEQEAVAHGGFYRCMPR